jgi:hypothetical protein
MSRPRILRLLRSAWSVACGILCLLLIVLWVRSLWVADEFRYGYVRSLYSIHSSYGVFGLSYVANAGFQLPDRRPRWRFFSRSHPNPAVTEFEQALVRKMASRQFRWTNRLPWYFGVTLPYWLTALLIATTGAAPWLRFSLRTLLIVTALIAVVLGLAVAG